MSKREKHQPSKMARGAKSLPLCAYCGIRPGVQREHVVARGFFHKLPLENLTIPACAECNQRRGDGGDTDITLEEEYMRTMVSMGERATSNAPAQAVLTGPVFRSFDRDRKSGLLLDIAKKMDWKWSRDEEGRLVPSISMRLDWHRIYRVVRKITKGLYYHVKGQTLPSGYAIIYRPVLTPEELAQLETFLDDTKTSPYLTLGDGKVFKVMIGADINDPNLTVYLMVFYGYFAIWSVTCPADQVGDGMSGSNAFLYQDMKVKG